MNINKILLSILFVMVFASSAYAYTITGQVTESGTAKPIASANVNIYDWSFNLINSTTTNSTGGYSVIIPNVTAAYRFNANAIGYVEQNKTTSVSGDKNINFTLGPQPSVSLYGYVRDTSNASIQGATVDVNIGSNTVQTATTDATGFYNVSVWNNTAYNVNAYKNGYYASVLSTTVVGNAELNFILTQVQQTGRIYGIVYNQSTANLLNGATVRVKQNGATLYSTQTVNGTYSIDVNPGTYDVTATMTGFLENTVTGIYVSFGQNITQDFNMTTMTIQTPPGPGDGGGGEPPKEETTFRIGAGKCDTNWTCTEWSACSNGYQTRLCTDLEECGSDEDKPIEGRKCTLPAAQPVNKSSEKYPWYTGAAILNFFKNKDNVVAAIIVLLVIGFVITISYFYLKKK